MHKTEELIEEVRKNQCLYDLSAEDYKNLYKKTKIWKNIAHKLDSPEEECKKRWRGLRDTYKRLRRAEKLATRRGAPYNAKRWKYMDTLTFLDNFKDYRAPVESTMENTVKSTGEFVMAENLLDYASLSSMEEDPFHLDVGESASSLSRARKPTELQADVEITTVTLFREMMQEYVRTVKELRRATCPQDGDATALLFASLAKRIALSNLTDYEVRRIEGKIVALVHSELDEFERK